MAKEKIVVNVDPDLEDLIPGFLENRSKDLKAMQEAQEKGDVQTLQSIGHSLKGVGGGYGFDDLSEIGAAIEVAAKSGDISTVPGLLDRLKDYLERVEVKFE